MRLEPTDTRADQRGWVCTPIDEAALPAQRNSHVVLTLPGYMRGNHFHRHGTETMLVLGPALVRVREAGTVRENLVAAGEVVRCVFPPGVSHAYQNTGPAPAIIVCFNTETFDRNAPDQVKDVLIES